MKIWIKYILAVILYYSGATTLLLAFRMRRRREPIILAYHCFLPPDDPRRRFLQQGMCVSPGVFDAQLGYVIRKFSVLSLEEMARRGRAGEVLQSDSIAITIDDGWRDNYEHAFPVLEKHKAPATIFLTSDFIGSDRVYWFVMAHRLLSGGDLTRETVDRAVRNVAQSDAALPGGDLNELSASLAGATDRPDDFIEALKQLNNEAIYLLLDSVPQSKKEAEPAAFTGRLMLDWDEIERMAGSVVSFGSHGRSHQILTLLDPDEIKREVSDSARTISDRLNRSVTLFSYPNGDYDDTVEDAVKAAGYLAAVTTSGKTSGETDWYALRRIGIHDGTSIGPQGGFSRAMFSLHLARSI